MGGGGDDSSEYQEQQLELQRQQLELQKQQITEPEKKVDSATQAKTDTYREQQLRRGLASAFSRSGVGQKSSSGATATSGSAGKLGD